MVPAIWVLIAVAVIEFEPDLGTAAVVGFILFVMMLVGGVSWKSMLLAILICSAGAGILIAKQPYRIDRIMIHQNRWSSNNMDDTGFQTVQSELGMAEGGLMGVGIGAGRTKHIIPAPTTDFIMATVGEETGLIGTLGILALMGTIVWRIFYLAGRAPTQFGALLLTGIGSWIAIQAGVNSFMANGTLFAIGIPMPYISSGGSSLVALWMAMAICQVAMKPIAQKEDDVESDRDRRGHGRARISRA
jgi:cell division protein FtsW